MINSVHHKKTFDLYAAAALQALIAKIPIIDRDGQFSEKIPSEEIEGIKEDLARSAFSYAFYMMKHRQEFIDSLTPKTQP